MNAVEDRLTPSVNGDLLDRVQQLRLDSRLGTAKAGRGGSGVLPWVLCGLLAATWAAVALRSYRAAPADADAAAATTSAAPSGSSATASTPGAPPAVAGTVQLEVKGYLVPARQIAVSPIEVAGRVVELKVVEGKLFNEGEMLARIDDTSYRTAAEEAKATLAAAEMRLAELRPKSVRTVEIAQVDGELNEAEANRKQAASDRDRYRNIPGTVAAKEMAQAETDYAAATARVARLTATKTILIEGPRQERIKAAEQDVNAARARCDQAEWRLSNCVIKAPITGTVLSKKSEKGNLVNPLAFSASSGSVCDIADLRDLEADLEIPERDIAKLKVGQPCRIKADAHPGREYAGVLDRIMPIANRAKSIVNVRAKVTLPMGEEPGTFLKPEMGAVVSFLAVK